MKRKPREWVKHCARGLAWVFGMFLAIAGVLPLLKRQNAVILIILLYLFLFGATIVFACDAGRVAQK